MENLYNIKIEIGHISLLDLTDILEKLSDEIDSFNEEEGDKVTIQTIEAKPRQEVKKPNV